MTRPSLFTQERFKRPHSGRSPMAIDAVDDVQEMVEMPESRHKWRNPKMRLLDAHLARCNVLSLTCSGAERIVRRLLPDPTCWRPPASRMTLRLPRHYPAQRYLTATSIALLPLPWFGTSGIALYRSHLVAERPRFQPQNKYRRKLRFRHERSEVQGQTCFAVAKSKRARSSRAKSNHRSIKIVKIFHSVVALLHAPPN